MTLRKTIRTILESVLIESLDDFGYRAGNLVNKAELLKNTKGIRGTGHFGTGFYFFGDENVAREYGKITKDREVSTIDLSKQNLLKVKDSDLGYQLHDELKKWDGFNINDIRPMILNEIKESIIFNLENGYSNWDGYDRVSDLVENIHNYLSKISDKDIDIDDVKNIIIYYLKGEVYNYNINKYISDNLDEVIKSINDLIDVYIQNELKNRGKIYKKFVYEILNHKLDKLRDIIKKIDPSLSNDAWDKLFKGLIRSLRRDPYLSVHGNKTTLGTELIKSLGYNGIDVRGTKLDNSMFGSVVYDIK